MATTTTTTQSNNLAKNSCKESLNINYELLEKAVAAALKKYLPKICEEVLVILSEYKEDKADLAISLPDVNTLFSLAAKNDVEKLSVALNISRESLLEIVKQIGFDTNGRVRRWKSTERIKEFLINELVLRANRNLTFLSD